MWQWCFSSLATNPLICISQPFFPSSSFFSFSFSPIFIILFDFTIKKQKHNQKISSFPYFHFVLNTFLLPFTSSGEIQKQKRHSNLYGRNFHQEKERKKENFSSLIFTFTIIIKHYKEQEKEWNYIKPTNSTHTHECIENKRRE